MTELAVSVRLKADGSGLVGQLRVAEAEVGKLTASLTAANREARALAGGTAAAQAGTAAIGRAANDAATGVDALATAAPVAATATAAIGAGAGAASVDLARLDAICAGLTTQMAAVVAGGAGLAGELHGVGASVAELAAGVTAATASTERLAAEQAAGAAKSAAAAEGHRLASAELARAAAETRGYEGELARLRAELDPAGEAARRMAQAVDFADTALAKGDITLEQHALALKRAETATRAHGAAAGNSQIAQMELEHVIRATSDSIAAGEPISRVFGMELGRVAEAATFMGGSFSKFGAFMSGPWGIAISIGVATLAPLIGGLLATSDATGEALAKLKEDAEKTDATRKAKEEFGHSLEGVAAAIRDQADALDKSINSEKSAAEQAYALARANVAKEVAIRAATAAMLEQAIAQQAQVRQAALDEQRYGKNDVNSLRLPFVDGRVSALQDQLAANNASLTTARATLNRTQVDLVTEQAKIAADPIKSINKLFDDQEKAAKNAARGNAALTGSLREQIIAIEDHRKASLKAEEERQRAANRKPRAVALGTQIQAEDGARLLASAQSFTGLNERRDAGPLETLFAKANEHIDPKMTAWCAAFVNAVLATNGLPGTGSLSARSFLGYGTATAKPEKGDIVVLGRGGDESKGHVGFYAGEGKNGRVLVTGGNQGDKVSTESFARDQVLGFRRAPTAAAGYKADEEAAKKVGEANKKAADELDRINITWNDQPRLIDRAAEDTKKLDAIITAYAGKQDEISRAIVAQATAEKQAVEDGKARPLREYVTQQAEELRVGQLILAGHQDQADALRTQIGLERQMGPLDDAQRAAVLDTARAMEAESRAIDVMRAKQQLYLDALGEVKGIVEDATLAFARGDLGQLIKTPKKLLDAFSQLDGKELFDKLFGDTFRKLEDQVTGRDKVGDASALMAAAVDRVTVQTKRTTGALGDLESAAAGAAKAVGGGAAPAAPVPVPPALAGATLGLRAPDLRAMLLAIPALPAIGSFARGAGGGGTTTEADGTVVVTADRRGQSAESLFSGALGKVATSITGLFTSPDNAERIGGAIGKFSGKALAGAATGSLVAGLSNAVGVHLNQTGAQLGGAVGGVLSGIKGLTSALGPLGGAIAPVLGVVGGLLGNLFAPKAKPGGVTVGNVDGEAGQTGTSGSDAKLIKASSGLGASVSGGLNKIVSQLGGSLGDFSVSIGKYKDDLRVNENGKALGGVKNSGAVSFGDDEAAAVGYAISRAVAQGAVQGVSAAVAKALQSSTDVDKALQEALNVADVEKLIGGIGAQLDGLFKDQAAKAADRVTLAKKYGLNLLAVEKANATERSDLIDSTLKSRIGSLQDVLTSLRTGDLSEGDAATRRAKLQDQIAAASKDAEAGKAGAADTLAQLERQLVQTSRDAFGTAGPEYAADRSSALDEVQKVVDLETQRINAAAGLTQATTAAVQANNDLTSETNDLLAQANTKLDNLSSTLFGAFSASATGVDYAAARRSAELAFA